MPVNDLIRLIRLGKAKIKDARARYTPKGHHETIERIFLDFELDPSSDEFARGLNDFWLFTRQAVNYQKELLKDTRAFTEQVSYDLQIKPIFSELLQTSLENSVKEKELLSKSIRLVRENYYCWRRGEISYDQFISLTNSITSLFKDEGKEDAG